jgi:hypothetical protein
MKQLPAYAFEVDLKGESCCRDRGEGDYLFARDESKRSLEEEAPRRVTIWKVASVCMNQRHES